MDRSSSVDGRPSIEVAITYAGKKGRLLLSSLYGSYKLVMPFKMPKGAVAGFYCPHCGAGLKSTRKCELCGSRMAAFELKDGGKVQICARHGCKKHMLEFQNLRSELETFYRHYVKTLR